MELKKSAVTTLQCFFRQAQARSHLKKLLLCSLEKFIDEETKLYYFYDMRTNDTAWEVSSLLKQRLSITEKDILTPRSRLLLKAKIESTALKIDKLDSVGLSEAAIKLQSIFRSAQARKQVATRMKSIVSEHYDKKAKKKYFYNAVTKISTWEKPKLLQEESFSSSITSHRNGSKVFENMHTQTDFSHEDVHDVKNKSLSFLEDLQVHGLQKLHDILITAGIHDFITLMKLTEVDINQLKIAAETKAELRNVITSMSRKNTELDTEKEKLFSFMHDYEAEILPKPESVKVKVGNMVSAHFLIRDKNTDKLLLDTLELGIPLMFKVGCSEVIYGVDKIVQNMSVGERGRLTLPSQLCYGKQGFNFILGKNTELDITVEIIESWIGVGNFNER